MELMGLQSQGLQSQVSAAANGDSFQFVDGLLAASDLALSQTETLSSCYVGVAACPSRAA